MLKLGKAKTQARFVQIFIINTAKIISFGLMAVCYCCKFLKMYKNVYAGGEEKQTVFNPVEESGQRLHRVML